MSNSVLSISRKSFSHLSRKAKIRYLVLIVLQVLTNFLDVVGVSLAGLISYIASGRELSKNNGLVKIFSPLFDLPLNQTQSILASAVFIFFVAKTIFSIWISNSVLNLLSTEAIRLTKNGVSSYFSKPIEQIQEISSQVVVNSFGSGLKIVIIEYLTFLSTVTSELLLMLSLGSLMFYINVKITILSLIYFSLVVIFLQRFVSRRLMDSGKIQLRNDIESGVLLQELVTNYREVYSARKLSGYLKKYFDSRENSISSGRRIQLLNVLPKYVLELALMGGIALLFLLIGLFGESGSLIVLFLAAGTRIMPSLIRINSSVNAAKGQIANACVGLDMIEQSEKNQFNQPDRQSDSSLRTKHESQIRFSNVTFKYQTRPSKVINKVSFSIQRGEYVGFVGDSGSGKSTLFDLMLGLLVPIEGSIEIDGYDPKTVHEGGIPRIAVVSQFTGIFNSTLRYNLILENQDQSSISDTEIWDALKFVGLERLVLDIPNGLDAQMGEFGSRFSGGQRQRLGIARAILQKPEILLLDEATSSLDAESENAITLLLNELKGKLTLISIAHRLSFVMSADRLLYFQNGELNSEGTFSSLLQNNDSFRLQAKLLGIESGEET